ncbi:MAG: glycosyltransferase family 2 protein [Candidatus Margulisiibacteriota bacterium]
MVSILIPVFNRADVVSKTLESALAQTHTDIEVIVVDNASTDGTWDIICAHAKADSRVRAFQNETNLGPVQNWLRCIQEARGDYGKIVWSDDWIAPDFLEKTLPLIEQNPTIGFVFSAIQMVDQTETPTHTACVIGATGLYPSDTYIQGIFLTDTMPLSPGCALFRLTDLRQNLWLDIPNPIHSNFAMHAIGNDLLLFLLTANQYAQFGFVAEPLAFFRAHPGSISADSGDIKLAVFYSLTKAFFAQTYRPDLIASLNTRLWFLLKRHTKKLAIYGLKTRSDFYTEPRPFCFNYRLFFSILWRKLIG